METIYILYILYIYITVGKSVLLKCSIIKFELELKNYIYIYHGDLIMETILWRPNIIKSFFWSIFQATSYIFVTTSSRKTR